MTWVKICGITTEVALEAAHDGADAVGLNIAPASPRAVTLDRAGELIARASLPAYLVSVDATPEAVEHAMAVTQARGVQPHGLHGHAVAALARERGWDVLFPVPMGGDRTVEPTEVPAGSVPLLDTASKTMHGGTGQVFEWSVIDDGYRPFVLAGGLGVDNVARAVRSVEPFGVDAASRLESAPGIKDPDTIRRFIEEVRSA